jgi:hypothetical protein
MDESLLEAMYLYKTQLKFHWKIGFQVKRLGLNHVEYQDL